MTAASEPMAAVRSDVSRYYTERLEQFGATPLGVGWTCLPTQELRFVQLAKLFDVDSFSLNDIGCGYGALLAYVRKRRPDLRIDYLGLDVSAAMVQAARHKWKHCRTARFDIASDTYRAADYCVASGVFNVKLGHERGTWERFVAHTLGEMYSRCRLGVAVNFLREDAALDDVAEHYRCAPERWIAHARQLGASVQLHEGYGMYEFTLLIRRR